MANSIQKITKYLHEQLDELFVNESVTGILEVARPGGYKLNFINAKTVLIPDMQLDALNDYSRANGYAAGDIDITFTPHTLQMDRGRQFSVDEMDDEESGGLVVINAMKTFERTQAIPEVDAYRLSKIASKATIAGTKAETIAANQVLAKFAEIEKYFEDNEVPTDRVIYFISTEISRLIKTTNELSRLLDVTEVENGDIKLKVKTFNGNPIIVVPPTRFKTAYTFGDGFEPTAAATDINILAVYDAISIPIQKHKSVRVFSPEDVQDKDGWKFNYRIYHDIFVPKNKAVGIYLSHKAAEPVKYTVTLGEGLSSSDAITGLSAGAKVNITITVPDGKEVDQFKVDGAVIELASGASTYELTVSKNHNVTVSFKDTTPGEGA